MRHACARDSPAAACLHCRDDSGIGVVAAAARLARADPFHALEEAAEGGLAAVAQHFRDRAHREAPIPEQPPRLGRPPLREVLDRRHADRGGEPVSYTHLDVYKRQAQFNALVEDLVDVMTARRVPVGAQNRRLKRLAPMHGDIVEP